MKAVQQVLHCADLESDTFFELCNIEVNTISPGTTRIISPKELFKEVLKLSERDQARLELVASRIEGLSCPIGQKVMGDLSHDTTSNPYDNAIRLLASNESDFRKAEEIRYVEYHRYHGRMWDGYYLASPVPLKLDVDLTDFENVLREKFNKNKLVVRRHRRIRSNDQNASVTVLQFIIYREGLPVSFEVLDAKGQDVVLETIHPAREYAVTYEPDTGVAEVYADQKSIRDVLKKTFCEKVLGQSDEPEKLRLRQVNLEMFREPPDFSDCCDLKHGITSVTVKELDLQDAIEKGTVIFRAAPRRAFQSDAYRTLANFGVSLKDNEQFQIRSVTLAFKCEETEELPKETLLVKLRAPNSCSLRDLSQRERYLNHDLLVKMGIVIEDGGDEGNEETSL